MEEETEITGEGTEESQEPITEERANELLGKVKQAIKQTNEGEEIFFVEDKVRGRKIELHSRILSVKELIDVGWITWSNFFNNEKGERKTYYG